MKRKSSSFLFIIAAALALTGRFSSALTQEKLDEEALFFTDNPQLDVYIRVILNENPGLQEALARYRAKLQQIPQVKSLPDPVLNFTQFVRSPETRVGPQSNVTKISQMFP